MSLDEYLAQLKQFEAQLIPIIETTIKKKESELVGFVKNRLYQYGVDSTGKEILPTYSRSTIEAKKEKRQRTSHVTLRDTGSFYDNMYIDVKKFIIQVWSKDEKTQHLVDKYGENILGFTQQEQDVIIYSILEPEINRILDELGKGGVEI